MFRPFRKFFFLVDFISFSKSCFSELYLKLKYFLIFRCFLRIRFIVIPKIHVCTSQNMQGCPQRMRYKKVFCYELSLFKVYWIIWQKKGISATRNQQCKTKDSIKSLSVQSSLKSHPFCVTGPISFEQQF